MLPHQPAATLLHAEPRRGAEILPVCEEQGIVIINDSPRAKPLAGTMTRERIKAMHHDDPRRNRREVEEPQLTSNLDLADLLKRTGARHGV